MVLAGSFRVDFIDVAGGRLGLCRLPGWQPAELGRDIAHLQRLATRLLFTLNRADELYGFPGLMGGDEGFFPAMARASFQHRHHEIANGGVPASLAEFSQVVDEACAALQDGQTIVIHCLAGLGRTGLMAACCLVRLGLKAERAIETVRGCRPGAIETPSQARYVQYFAAQLRGPR